MFVNFLQTLVFVGTKLLHTDLWLQCMSAARPSQSPRQPCKHCSATNHYPEWPDHCPFHFNPLPVFIGGHYKKTSQLRPPLAKYLAETSTTLYTDAQTVDMTNAYRDFNYSIHRCPDHRLTNAVNNAEPNILLKPAVASGSTGSLIQP